MTRAIPSILAAVALMASGGWTYTGTVTGKSYMPPEKSVSCVGKSCAAVVHPECWRLDLQQWIFTGWACAPDRATWDRVRVGDRWPS